MPSRFGSCRRAAFDIPPASHLNWRAKRLLTRASSPTLDAALCGVKGNSDTSSRNSHVESGFRSAIYAVLWIDAVAIL
jgi:hypothetical protein